MTGMNALIRAHFEEALSGLSLKRGARVPLHSQLAEALRQLILRGQIPPDTRLPGSRMLAQNLSISQATVLAAFHRLIWQGYLLRRQGAGIYVARMLPLLADPVSSDAPSNNRAPMEGGALNALRSIH
jgi:GntR family transcriptional regulator / MocR family aminotransferase